MRKPLVSFVPAGVSGLAMCQRCWATVPLGATHEHAEWHDELEAERR